MRIDAYFAPGQVEDSDVEGRTVIAIDVIRATSSIVEAMANGARAIFPTASVEEAIKLGSSLDRSETLLCGERKGLPIEGFDLGNSPSEYGSDAVQGKQLVMTTTNGTRALLAGEGADRVIAASFLNLSAVVEDVRGQDLAIICAGKEDRFSLDDVVFAGHIIRRLGDSPGGGVVLNDAAQAAAELARAHAPSAEFFRGTAAGAALVEVGLEEDLALCAAVDKHTIVPEMYDRMIQLPRG